MRNDQSGAAASFFADAFALYADFRIMAHKTGDNIMYDISIVVITYNLETTILETLESIKYQITKFGAHITFQLILADDASTDSTRAKIEKRIL